MAFEVALSRTLPGHSQRGANARPTDAGCDELVDDDIDALLDRGSRSSKHLQFLKVALVIARPDRPCCRYGRSKRRDVPTLLAKPAAGSLPHRYLRRVAIGTPPSEANFAPNVPASVPAKINMRSDASATPSLTRRSASHNDNYRPSAAPDRNEPTRRSESLRWDDPRAVYLLAMTASVDDSVTIVVKRRTLLQDLVRRHTVFLDGNPVGKLWAFQTRAFLVAAGDHSVRLAIVGTGTSSSADVKLNVGPGETMVLRTVGRGFANNAALPLAMPAGIRAQTTGKPIQSRFYKGPWIHLVLESAKATAPPSPMAPPAAPPERPSSPEQDGSHVDHDDGQTRGYRGRHR
jgi:hypothetical protein